ncbi:MAG: hypothetical protein ACAH22_02375 [Tardiphaga sp.]
MTASGRRLAKIKRSKEIEDAAFKSQQVECVSGVELASLLASPPFSERWLRELADKGYLVKAGRAKYELAESVRGYIRYVQETALGAEQPSSVAKHSKRSAPEN